MKLEIKQLAKHGDLKDCLDLLQVILVGFVRCDKLRAVKILYIQFCTIASIASKLLIQYIFLNLLINVTCHNIFNRSVQYGRDMENKEKKHFELLYGIHVNACGLCIDKDYPYLAASPGK